MTKRVLKYLFHIDHLMVTLITFLLVWLLSVFTFNVSFMSPVANAIKNLSMTDVFFKIQNGVVVPDTSQLITIVDMTELTSRGEIGELLEEVSAHEPIAIGVDLIFEGMKDDVEGNLILESAISEISDKTVFAYKLIDYDEQRKMFTNTVFPYFDDLFPITLGYANVTDDMERATIRTFIPSMLLNKEPVFSLAAELAKKMGVEVNGKEKETLINYEPTTFPVVSYNDLKKNTHLIKDHIVLIGTYTEEQDMHLSPLGKTPGVEIQAYTLQTLLQHKRVDILSHIACLVIGFILCYLFAIIIDLSMRLCTRGRRTISLFFAESELPIQIVTIVWLAIITFGAFALFTLRGIYIDTVLILVLMAMVVESRNLYRSAIKALAQRHPNWFTKHSLFK